MRVPQDYVFPMRNRAVRALTPDVRVCRAAPSRVVKLARCFKHLSSSVFLTSRCQRTRALHPEYIPRCKQELFFREIYSRLNTDVRHHCRTSLLIKWKKAHVVVEIFAFQKTNALNDSCIIIVYNFYRRTRLKE